MPSVNMSNYVKLEIRYDGSSNQEQFRLFGHHNNGTESWLHTFEEGTFPVSIAQDTNGDDILTLGAEVTQSGNFDLIADTSGHSLVAFSADFVGIRPSTGVIGVVDVRPGTGGPIRRIKLDSSHSAFLKFVDGSSGWTCAVQHGGSETDDLEEFFGGSYTAFVKTIN